MHALTDVQWAKFEAAIAAVGTRGARPRTEERRTIEAIIWGLENGAKWRSIPTEMGNWHHAYLRHRRWAVRGVWDKTHGAPGCSRRAAAYLCLHRWNHRPGASKGIWCAVRRTVGQRPESSLRRTRGVVGKGEAPGRSRSGLGTKIVGV